MADYPPWDQPTLWDLDMERNRLLFSPKKDKEQETPMFRFEIDVLAYDRSGDRVTSRTPTTILAKDKAEVDEKVRVVFNATYDDFRKFWSHRWVLRAVNEVTSVRDGGVR